MKLGFSSVKCIQVHSLQKRISFRGEDWFSDPVDTFETSAPQVQKKKKGFSLNPIKAAQEEAREIIRRAKNQAFQITLDARFEAEKESEEYLRQQKHQARVTAQQEADRYEKSLKADIDAQIEYSRTYFETQRAELEAQNKALASELESKQKLITALNDGYIEQEIGAKKSEIMSRVSSYQIDYDYNRPIEELTGRDTCIRSDRPKTKFNEYSYIPKAKSSEVKLDIPEFVSGENWSFSIPKKTELKLSEYTPLEFTELHDQETNISMNYADSVKWNSDKISRDILQNFFDGHGQTLDGVKLSFEKQENGKYKVRIEGESQYSQEKAILLGETTKRNNSKAAGNYGEGLKVVVLKLLKEYGATDVNIASDNWNVRFQPMKSNICEKDVLSYSLLKSEPIEGNYLEFETDSEELLNSLRSAVNNFYHSSNTDFQNLDFENDSFAIKRLGEGKKGSIYIAGQKFEYMNSHNFRERGWDVLPGYTLIFKEKPDEKSDFDISRDRMILQRDNLKNLVSAAVSSDKTTQEELCTLLCMFKDSWKEKVSYFSNSPLDSMLLESIITGIAKKGIKYDFPSRYLASQKGFNNNGYDYFYEKTHTVCKPEFSAIGMKRTVEKAYEDKPQHLVKPTEIQVKKIALIKETLNCLKPSIRRADPRYYGKELNPNIYIFEKSDVFSGEHRADGFWISSEEMTQSFDKVLSTVLHEISHDHGGDGSEEFTYTLTNMLQAIINATLKDEETLITLRALKACWEDLRTQEIEEYRKSLQ